MGSTTAHWPLAGAPYHTPGDPKALPICLSINIQRSYRRGPPFSYKPCAWAVTDHEAGPPYKPCAWTVTDHVMDINSSVRLASALAEPCTASSEHIRSLCSNARPCGAQRRTRAAIASTSLVEEHRRTLFGF